MSQRREQNGQHERNGPGVILLKLTPLERLSVRHAAELAGVRPTTWARRELVRRANAAIRRAQRLATAGAA